jgi:hypothetical protein
MNSDSRALDKKIEAHGISPWGVRAMRRIFHMQMGSMA